MLTVCVVFFKLLINIRYNSREGRQQPGGGPGRPDGECSGQHQLPPRQHSGVPAEYTSDGAGSRLEKEEERNGILNSTKL